MRQQRFGYSFEVSLDFLAAEPAQAQRWIEARLDQFGKQRYARGPRGGTYRLVGPPDAWRTNVDPFWHPGTATYLTKRYGRYVRPDRVRVVDKDMQTTFGSFDIPVKDGKAMLPDGSVVTTDPKCVAVAVPVPPAFDDVGSG